MPLHICNRLLDECQGILCRDFIFFIPLRVIVDIDYIHGPRSRSVNNAFSVTIRGEARRLWVHSGCGGCCSHIPSIAFLSLWSKSIRSRFAYSFSVAMLLLGARLFCAAGQTRIQYGSHAGGARRIDQEAECEAAMQKADFAEHSTGQVTSQRSVAYALSLVVNHLAGYYFCF